MKLDRAWPLAAVAMGILGLVCKRKQSRQYHSDNCAYSEEQTSKHSSTDSRPHRNKSWPLAVLALILAASHAQAEDGIRNQFGMRTPMRDGVNLSSDIWFPQEPGRYPIILVRTPYIKAAGSLGLVSLAKFGNRGRAICAGFGAEWHPARAEPGGHSAPMGKRSILHA